MDTAILSNRSGNKFSLFALLAFLLVFLFGIFYVRPLWGEVDSLTLGRDDKLNQKQTLQLNLDKLRKLQDSLNLSSEITKETTFAAIPEKVDQDKLIMDLHAIAQKNDISLNGVNFSIPPVDAKSKINKITINANLTGFEDSLIDFLRGVEANARKILVKSITVQVGEVDGETVDKRVNFNVSMEAYYQGSL